MIELGCAPLKLAAFDASEHKPAATEAKVNKIHRCRVLL
jgi:hypothetical protein